MITGPASTIYAPLPLATTRVSGDVALASFDPGAGGLGPVEIRRFADVDLDAWGLRALRAFDAHPEGLAEVRRTLAGAIAASVEPVLEGPADPEALAAAREAWRQALTTELAAAYGPPVPRIAPTPPVVVEQVAEQTLDAADARALLASATTWTRVARYEADHAEQDEIRVVVALGGEAGESPPPDAPHPLLAPLARLVVLLPELEGILDDPDAAQARKTSAAEALRTLAADVAAQWPSGAGPAAAGPASPPGFTIAETAYGAGELLVTVARDPEVAADVPAPTVAFAGYEPVPTGSGVRYRDAETGAFLTAAEAGGRRRLRLGPLPVLTADRVRLGLQVVRNASLVPGARTREAFVYRTPVAAVAAFLPSLVVDEAIDVAAVATGAPEPRPLADQLRALLGGIFAAVAPGIERTVAIQVGYRLAIEGGVPVTEPVARMAPGPVAAAGVPELAETLAGAIRGWSEAAGAPAGGALTFDLSVFADAAGEAPPLVRLRGLTLGRADVSAFT